MSSPRLLITLGDVAGIGPEIVARAWPQLVQQARPVVVGDPGWVERGSPISRVVRPGVEPVKEPGEAQPSVTVIPCLSGHVSGA